MNIRNVLRTYSLLRQLTDDESAFLETLRGLNDAERESLVVALQPEKMAGKRASKKSSKSASKSSRASGLGTTITRNLSQYRQVANTPCVALVDDNGGEMECGQVEQNPIHDPAMGYGGYHEFDAGKSSVPRVGGKLSTNGGAGSVEEEIDQAVESARA
jgi:hypothetical protein